jgi:hypothetical protein
MAWLCLRNNDYRNSQMCIVTGPNIDIAIKLIKRMKGLFEPKLGVTFDSKETVLELNGCRIEAYPSNHIDAYRALDNPKFILLLSEDFFGFQTLIFLLYDSMQYSFQEDKLQLEVKEPGSIFTRAIVEGLNTGKADLDEDGLVSYDELYDYTFDRVIDEMPSQRPQKWEFGVEGDVIITKNPYKKKTESIIEDPNKLVQDALDPLKKGDYNATDLAKKTTMQ